MAAGWVVGAGYVYAYLRGAGNVVIIIIVVVICARGVEGLRGGRLIQASW